MNCPQNIIRISDEPVFDIGSRGLFDDAGVWANSIVQYKTALFLYYTGWQLSQNVPYYTYCGLAELNTNTQKFERIMQVPVMDRTHEEPFSVGFCEVKSHEGKLKMWYEYRESFEESSERFVIKYAESSDGKKWIRRKLPCITPKKDESCISRPSVIIEDKLFKMWYSYKLKNKYRIGYAESINGTDWIRKDSIVGIQCSEDGWDSDEIEYPCVFDYKGSRYMLYNGNGYGKTGFGIAKLID